MSVPLSISVAAALNKARVADDDAWVVLAKITWPDGSVLRLARNPDDITFDTGDGGGPQNFIAFSWDFQDFSETSDGSIPNWGVKVSNVNRAIESLLEEFGGGVGGTVTLYVVQAKRLKREPDIEYEFDITGCSSDASWVTFTLGATSPFRILMCRHTYTADSCIWRYQSDQCGYTGTMPSCSYTLGGSNGCRAHGNQQRYGGFPGVGSNGFRYVQR